MERRGRILKLNTKINTKNLKLSISSSQSAYFRAVKLSQLSSLIQNCKPAKLKSQIGLAGLLATMVIKKEPNQRERAKQILRYLLN
jgi:hypothetical protein